MLKTRELTLLKQQRDIQSVQIVDDYSAGIYNGIEICIALLEGREPQLFLRKEEPEDIFEEEQKKGRTAISGVRRVSK